MSRAHILVDDEALWAANRDVTIDGSVSRLSRQASESPAMSFISPPRANSMVVHVHRIRGG